MQTEIKSIFSLERTPDDELMCLLWEFIFPMESEVSTRFSLWCVLSSPLSLTYTQNEDDDYDEDDVYDCDDAKSKEYKI